MTQQTQSSADWLEVTQQATINASADSVWAICREFGGADRWIDVVEKVTITRGGDNAPGTVRRLDLNGGGTVEEELLALDDAKHALRYRIVGGVLPVSDYESELRVQGGNGSATVVWSGRFKRQDQGPQPAEGADDATAKGAITGVYEMGLAGLKQASEAA